MAFVIESLESRLFLSATSPVMALKAERAVAHADLRMLDNAVAANLKLIQGELKKAGKLKSSKALLATLSAESTMAFNTTGLAVAKAMALITGDANRLVSVAARLAADAGNAALQANLTASTSALKADSANRLTTVSNDITNEENTDSANLDAIESANPGDARLSADVANTVEPRAAAAGTALLDAVTTVLTTDVSAVLAASVSVTPA